MDSAQALLARKKPEQRFLELKNLTISDQTLQLNERSSIDDYVRACAELQGASIIAQDFRQIPLATEELREKISLIDSLRSNYPHSLQRRARALTREFSEHQHRLERFAAVEPSALQTRETLQNLFEHYEQLQRAGIKVNLHLDLPTELQQFAQYREDLAALDRDMQDTVGSYVAADWEHDDRDLRCILQRKINGTFFSEGLEKRCNRLKAYEHLQTLSLLQRELKDTAPLIALRRTLQQRINEIHALRDVSDEDAMRLAKDYEHDDGGRDLMQLRSLYLDSDLRDYCTALQEFRHLFQERKREIGERKAKIRELDAVIATSVQERVERYFQEHGPRIPRDEHIMFSLESFLDSLTAPSSQCYFLRNILQETRYGYGQRLERFAEALTTFTSTQEPLDMTYLLRIRAGLERALTQGSLRQQFAYGKITQDTIDKAFTAIDGHLGKFSEVHENA